MPKDVRLIRSPISVAGMVLTTISAVFFLVVFLAASWISVRMLRAILPQGAEVAAKSV